jgi:hypothetical protein
MKSKLSDIEFVRMDISKKVMEYDTVEYICVTFVKTAHDRDYSLRAFMMDLELIHSWLILNMGNPRYQMNPFSILRSVNRWYRMSANVFCFVTPADATHFKLVFG